jgi:hypothetical protein
MKLSRTACGLHRAGTRAAKTLSEFGWRGRFGHSDVAGAGVADFAEEQFAEGTASRKLTDGEEHRFFDRLSLGLPGRPTSSKSS